MISNFKSGIRIFLRCGFSSESNSFLRKGRGGDLSLNLSHHMARFQLCNMICSILQYTYNKFDCSFYNELWFWTQIQYFYWLEGRFPAEVANFHVSDFEVCGKPRCTTCLVTASKESCSNLQSNRDNGILRSVGLCNSILDIKTWVVVYLRSSLIMYKWV